MDTDLAPASELHDALESSGAVDVCRLSGAMSIEELRDVVGEFRRFAVTVLEPTNRIGDTCGVSFDPATGSVGVPDAIRWAYARFVESGWAAAGGPSAYGGGGLPHVVRLALDELSAGANLALSLAPTLTAGAVELLASAGSPAQRDRYLPPLVRGEWTGTMNLTEPDAGSDLGAVRTVAVPDGDVWILSGTKVFITWGDHDLTDNTVHLVLARTPGSPPGSKGLSLFVAPKYLADGRRNGIHCRGVEQKLGIHGSPTCVLEYDGAVGELVGEQHRGLAAMFTMMNAARLGIAAQGVATAEACSRQASRYANERVQGTPAGGGDPSPIIGHPDVARMVMDLRSTARAMRLLLLFAAAEKDLSSVAGSPSLRRDAARSVGVLTPVVKAWCTDSGFRLASTAMQVFGGVGYVEETGVPQRLRDARIGPIYEGTNGIQAIDLVVRKVGTDGGTAVAGLAERIRTTLASDGPVELNYWYAALGAAVDALCRASAWLLRPATGTADRLAGANSYLELVALTLGGWRLGAHALRLVGAGSPAAAEAVADAVFFATEHLLRVPSLEHVTCAGARRLRLTVDTTTTAP